VDSSAASTQTNSPKQGLRSGRDPGRGPHAGRLRSGLTGVQAVSRRSFRSISPRLRGKKWPQDAAFEVSVRKSRARVPSSGPKLRKSLAWPKATSTRCARKSQQRGARSEETRGRHLKQKVMQALLDSTTLELPKSLVEIELQRMVQQTRADSRRGPEARETACRSAGARERARRRVALGLVLGELVRSIPGAKARAGESAGHRASPDL